MSKDSLVTVVRIGPVTKHPNADLLSQTVVDGTPTLFKTGDFSEGDLAVFVPVDMLVPVSQPEFSWCRGRADVTHRIKAIRLRGVYSEGLLVRPRSGMTEGQEVSDALGIQKYLPPAEREPQPAQGPGKRQRRWAELEAARRACVLGVAVATCLSVWVFGVYAAFLFPLYTVLAYLGFRYYAKWSAVPAVQIYDIEALRRHPGVFAPEEDVVVTEKIHGCHFAAYRLRGKLRVYSRTVQRPHDGSNVWSRVAARFEDGLVPEGCVLRGEIYGKGIQNLDYGTEEMFRAFDIQDFKTRQYWSYADFANWCDVHACPRVPVLYGGPWSLMPPGLEEGKTTLGGDHVREGFVVKPVLERTASGLGRCIVKVIGEGYRLRKGQPE